MSPRLLGPIALLLSACTADGNVPVLCEDDGGCPFEQCCVRGACIDPGPGGSCGSASIASSSLVVTPSTIVAGTTTDVRITVRDAYGRPIARSAAEVLIQSTCATCDTIASDDWTTDANGNISATFTSTGSGTKILTLRVGSTLATPTLVQVVPDVAVSVGFASSIADTPIGSPLAQVAVTRLDIYGNPDALPANPPDEPTQVEVQLEVNPAAIQLVNEAGTVIPVESRTVPLTRTRVPLEGLYVPFVAYNLRLVAFDASSAPSLAASQSNLFDITVPHITSTTSNVLSAGQSAPATLEWAVTPEGTPTIIQENDTGTLATSPLRFTPAFDGESTAMTHVRIRPHLVNAPLDVEATRMGIARAFAPSRRSGSQVNILDLKRFSNGDILVVGSFNYDMLLGERGEGAPLVTAVVQTGLEGFIARFDPTARTVKWVDLFYGVDNASRGINVTIKDVDVSRGDVVAIAEFNGAGAGWRFEKPVAGGEAVVQQCTLGSTDDKTSYVTSVARIDALTGVVVWCSGIHDPDPTPATGSDPKITNARAGVVASVNTDTAYVAVRLTENAKIWAGRIVNGATPAPRIDGAGAVLADIDQPFPTPIETGCSAGYTALLPIKAGTLDGAREIIATGVSYEPTALLLDPGGQSFTLAGNACSAGTAGAGYNLELGRTVKIDTAARMDGTLVRVDASTGSSGSAKLNLLWQPHGTGVDRIWELRTYLDDFIVYGDFADKIPLGSDPIDPYKPGFATAFIARVTRQTPHVVWSRLLGSSGGSVTPYGLSVSGDRIVAVAQAIDDVVLTGSPHKVIDMNEEIPDPVGLLVELDPDGEPRWSSPFSGTTRPSRPLALAGGSVMMGLCGLQGSVIGAGLDAVPLRQVIQRGGRYEPILGLYTPYDFVVRDIVRAP